MEGGPETWEAKKVAQLSKRKNEAQDPTSSQIHSELGANTRKHKEQIKQYTDQDSDLKKQEALIDTFRTESLMNEKLQVDGHMNGVPKPGDTFQKDSQSVSPDTRQSREDKNLSNKETLCKKSSEVRGSETSVCPKLSTCPSLNPVMENTSENTSGANEVSFLCRESSSRESMDRALKSEQDFMEYVMSLPSSQNLCTKEMPGTEGASKSKQKQATPALSSTTKVGLDHLDNLCKLMEQLSELKETNSKLQKRVQYLEDLKTLHDMHKEIRQDSQNGRENVLVRKKQMGLKKMASSGDQVKHSQRASQDFTEIPEGAATASTVRVANKDTKLSSHRGRVSNSSVCGGVRRERSKSVGHEDAFDGKPRRIFPKWSKVKEAFGWERALPEDHVKQQQMSQGTDVKEMGSKSKPSDKYRDNSSSAFFRGNRRVFTEDYVANLGIPYYSDYAEKEDDSPPDYLTGCDLWKHNLNFHSSSEDISRLVDAYNTRRGSCKRDSETSTKRISLLEPPSEAIKRQKSTPSPNSERCRTYHEILDLKPKSLTIERDIDAEQAFAKFEKEDGKKSHKSPWGRVKTIIERRRDSLKRRHQRRGPEPEPSSPIRAQDLNMTYTTHSADDLDYQSHEEFFRRKSSADQLLESPVHPDSFQKSTRDYTEADKCRRKCRTESSFWKNREEDDESIRPEGYTSLRCSNSAPNQDVAQYSDVLPADSRCVSGVGGEYPTPCSSPQFHRKSRWLRMKKALRGKKEGEAVEPSSLSMPASPNGIHEATFDFEDNEGLYEDGEEGKFVDGTEERRRNKGHCRDSETCSHSHEMARVGSDSYVHKLSLSSSAPISDIMMELQRNLSEDFNRKIVEWERIRSLGGARTTSPKWDRKNSEPKSRSKKQDKPKTDRIEKTTKPKIKDLSWLEKELQKIEKEKLRLSKEKEKYEERAIRLERLRQTVLNANSTNKKEVLVRTSAGEFRFEGISDAFTKKLYEWETKRGVCPELSTIALLDSSVGQANKPGFIIQQAEKCSLLHRAMSRSESSLPEIGQPSHTSSNSLPSLKPPDSGDMERVHLQSRASSEPDLTSMSAIANNSSRNGICLTPYENVSVAEVFQTEGENSRDSLCDVVKDQSESYTPTGITQLIDSYTEGGTDEERRDETETEKREENYYSMLEENVILLEQLKKKEEICRRLEKELELLDEKVDEMNSHHQNEMERYREKLWEMHRPGTTPREAQGCLQIISELRTRIGELEKCSERLRNDRDTIEDSFRYHSEQQEHMTLDLLGKMRELQAAGGSPVSESVPADSSEFKRSKRKLLPILDMKIVDKLQSLSAQLVKQTTDLENTLAERTRQICQLRWELLHRDVSTVKLETELHTAHIQGSQHPCRAKCDAKRSKYAHFRSLSSEEASSSGTRQQEKRYPEFDRLVHQSQELYSHLPKTEFQATDLSCTVHELSKELLRLSTAAEVLSTPSEDEDQQDKLTQAKTENAVQRIQLSESEKEISLEAFDPSASGNLCCRIEGTKGKIESDSVPSSQIRIRRNSADVSSVSGPEVSETSSVNESVGKSEIARALPPKRRISSSSAEESSEVVEEKFISASYNPNKGRPTGHPGKEIILRRVTSRKEPKKKDSSKDKSCGKYSLDKRITNSDSKIPLPNSFKIVKSGSVGSYDRSRKEVHPDDRSFTTREKREPFTNKREHVLRRRLKPPPLDIKMAEASNERPPTSSNGSFQDKTLISVHQTQATRHVFKNGNSCTSPVGESYSTNDNEKNLKLGVENSSPSVVTVKLPRRKPKTGPKRTQAKDTGRQDGDPSYGDKESVEATVTVVLPKKKRSVDRQLPKRSSTDGDVRELMLRENPAFQGNIVSDKATLDACGSLRSYEDDKDKKDVSSVVAKVQNAASVGTPNCAKDIPDTVEDAKATPTVLSLRGSILATPTNSRCSTKDVRQEGVRPGYFKSPSAPQLDRKWGRAKKTSREGAPNVKCLIEKYNQKVMENQSPKIPRSTVWNSGIPIRKISAVDWKNHRQEPNIPSTSTEEVRGLPDSSMGSSTSVIHSSNDIYDANSTRLRSPPLSPPTSPASKVRAEALQKAKENFMSSGVAPIRSQVLTEKVDKSLEYTTTNHLNESKTKPSCDANPDDDGVSSSSTRSMDSTSLVVYRTGESCQESRLARKAESARQKVDVAENAEGIVQISAQSISTPSIPKNAASYEFRLPTSLMNLKLRRSKRKKDLATVSALCRQSLLLTRDEDREENNSTDARKPIMYPRSCPSSPELKSKSKPKTSWLQWSILKHK